MKNMVIAFILNISFSIFEFIGGMITGSISIVSDAIHDLGDAISIGISLILEKISKKKPDDKYTYGYVRYSILGAFITSVLLATGSIIVIISGINRIANPIDLNYNGMIIFAIFGFVINFLAAYFTREKSSLNQKSLNLHMLEDVLGWLVVLIGSVLMKFTNINLIDTLMSIGIAIFILIHTFENLKEILDLFLEKTPSNVEISKIKEEILKIKGIEDIHHIHIWSMDGNDNFATMHIVGTNVPKEQIRKALKNFNIVHTTIEVESPDENCQSKKCH